MKGVLLVMTNETRSEEERRPGCNSDGIARLPKEFSTAKSLGGMIACGDGLRALFEAMRDELVPGPGYDMGDLNRFASSAVRGQRGLHANIGVPGSWSVVGVDDPMPSDARVDFVFTPTYLVVAILTLLRARAPQAAGAIPGFDEALRRGMVFATLRGLRGHGLDSEAGLRNALAILEGGGIFELLEREPRFCPELCKLAREAGSLA